MSATHYDVLGLDVTVNAEQIKVAYKKRAKETHPDKNGGTAASGELFKSVALAYEILSDPVKKRDSKSKPAQPKPAAAPSSGRSHRKRARSSSIPASDTDSGLEGHTHTQPRGRKFPRFSARRGFTSSSEPGTKDMPDDWSASDNGSATLCLLGITNKTTHEMVRAAFESWARIKGIDIRDLEPGALRYSLVQFYDRADAIRAKEMHSDGLRIGDAVVRVGWGKDFSHGGWRIWKSMAVIDLDSDEDEPASWRFVYR